MLLVHPVSRDGMQGRKERTSAADCGGLHHNIAGFDWHLIGRSRPSLAIRSTAEAFYWSPDQVIILFKPMRLDNILQDYLCTDSVTDSVTSISQPRPTPSLFGLDIHFHIFQVFKYPLSCSGWSLVLVLPEIHQFTN